MGMKTNRTFIQYFLLQNKTVCINNLKLITAHKYSWR